RLVRAGHRVSVVTTGAALTVTKMEGVRLEVIRAPRYREQIGRSFSRALLLSIWGVREVDAVIAADCPAPTLALVMLFCLIRGIPFVRDERGEPAEPSATAPWFS